MIKLFERSEESILDIRIWGKLSRFFFFLNIRYPKMQTSASETFTLLSLWSYWEEIPLPGIQLFWDICLRYLRNTYIYLLINKEAQDRSAVDVHIVKRQKSMRFFYIYQISTMSELARFLLNQIRVLFIWTVISLSRIQCQPQNRKS